MAREDRASGPRVGQTVEYSNSGTLVPAMVYAVSATTGQVSLVYFNASGATSVTGVNYDANLASGTWRYPEFL